MVMTLLPAAKGFLMRASWLMLMVKSPISTTLSSGTVRTILSP